MKRIVEQLVKSEGVRHINEHTQQVGMFAKRAHQRPTSAAPTKTRTFEEIAGDADSGMKRTTSLGAAQRRRLK